QLGLVRTASGALGAALGARFELERLRHQPGRDPVTGLPDERAFNARLVEELSRACRHGLPLALVHVEVDHFAALRERYGAEIAEGTLREASLVLKLALRESDILGRLAGGRFAALLPETASTPALRCADRLRRTLEDHRFARVGRVSATAAVATSPRDGLDAVELLEAVGRSLAVARKSGRRRVSASPPRHLQ
ncbi:MAG TPA: GGDEF domain-containing protein, partial [Candidatus Eisenbacteria bacterium]